MSDELIPSDIELELRRLADSHGWQCSRLEMSDISRLCRHGFDPGRICYTPRGTAPMNLTKVEHFCAGTKPSFAIVFLPSGGVQRNNVWYSRYDDKEHVEIARDPSPSPYMVRGVFIDSILDSAAVACECENIDRLYDLSKHKGERASKELLDWFFVQDWS